MRWEINEVVYVDYIMLFIIDQEILIEMQMFCLGNLVYFFILLKLIVIQLFYMFSSRDLIQDFFWGGNYSYRYVRY